MMNHIATFFNKQIFNGGHFERGAF